MQNLRTFFMLYIKSNKPYRCEHTFIDIFPHKLIQLLHRKYQLLYMLTYLGNMSLKS